MEVKFIEKYTKLGDIKEGQVAVSKDRKEFFVCCYYWCATLKLNKKIIINLNYLSNNQYTETLDLEQLVKILKRGDKFVCEV